MKILITGINGFVGSYLAEYCLQCGYDVFGLVRHRGNLVNIESIRKRIILFEGTITDSSSVNRIINEIKPDRVFHLAAQSFVPYSWIAPQETVDCNVGGTLNVLEAVKTYSPNSRVLIAGTSEEYGKWEVPDYYKFNPKLGELEYIPPTKLGYGNIADLEMDMGCKFFSTTMVEETPLNPLSTYGVSKVAADLLGYLYFKSYGLKVIRTRAFNHEGPRRGREFVTTNFIRQALLLKNGLIETIKVGNLDAVRDFSDVRDIVRAYWYILDEGQFGEVYNICSEKGLQIKDLLRMIMQEVLGTYSETLIENDINRMRPSDVPILIGNCSKFKKKTNWSPQIEFKDTIKEMIKWEEKCF